MKVERSGNSTGDGSYEIELADLRPAADRDVARIQAERLYYQAVQLKEQTGLKNGRPALTVFEEAAGLWHSLGDPYVEALCLSTMAAISVEIGENRKALEYYSKVLPLWRAIGDWGNSSWCLRDTTFIRSGRGHKQVEGGPPAQIYDEKAMPGQEPLCRPGNSGRELLKR